MGSYFSTTLQLPEEVIRGPPRLPLDVFLEIISHLRLDSYADRQALLSLAPCCSTLRDACQRILFKSMHREQRAGDDRYTAIYIHEQFLSAVIDSPDRLALYVRSYSQVRLSLGLRAFQSVEGRSMRSRKARYRLLCTTESALPLMIHLKHLNFKPTLDGPGDTYLLKNCTFQLESFKWVGSRSLNQLFQVFLANQPKLLHLDVDSKDPEKPTALPSNLCPALESVASTLSIFPTIAESRPIVALHFRDGIFEPVPVMNMVPEAKERFFSMLHRLKYLRLERGPRFHRLMKGISLENIEVLEIYIWPIEGLSDEINIQFPQLRVLRPRLHYASPAHSNRFYSEAEELSKKAFNLCSKLETVIFSGSENYPTQAWVFSKGEENDVSEELVNLEASRLDSSLWWKVYNI